MTIGRPFTIAATPEPSDAEADLGKALVVALTHYRNGFNNRHLVPGLILDGADVNYKDSFGWTPLMYAVRDHDVTVTQILLHHGANPNTQEPSGMTPLILLANTQDPSLPIARALVDSGAALRKRDNRGLTALGHARALMRDELVQFLRRAARPADKTLKL